jgi:hypothetical protein
MTDTSTAPYGCIAVSEHISREIPITLWHYTNFQALYGIVTSKRIWATEYRFLNDREEFVHAKKLAMEVIEGVPELVGQLFPARDAIRRAVNLAFNTGPLREDRCRIMMASFSEHGDLLSQWRGYSGLSTGVSIGLDLRDIRPPSDLGSMVTFAPCLYADDEKRALLKAIFDHFSCGLQKWWDSMISLGLQQQMGIGQHDPQLIRQLISEHSKEQHDVLAHFQTHMLSDLLKAAPLLKDKSFAEEKEWRLVLPVNAARLPTNPPFEFRPGRDALIPYIAHPLNNLASQEEPIKCNDLILGPGSHPSAEVGVNLFLEAQHIRVLARASMVPYRPA